MKILLALSFSFGLTGGLLIPEKAGYKERATACENTATSRSCWGEYDIDTDYYNVIPDTGVTREVSPFKV
jgi:hypothetical protein